jgi:hypothetical protein
MSVRDVSNALKHVHNNLDVDTQWRRARSGLAEMTDLERAQVWTVLSSLTLILDEKTAPVIFSQYKALYKAAMKSVEEKQEMVQCCCTGREGGSAMNHKESGVDGKEHPGGIEYKDQERGSALYPIEMLDKYEKLLGKYQFSIDSFQGMQREGEKQLILNVQQIINQSELWGEMKKQIKDTLDKGVGDLIKEINTSETKTALVSSEASLTTISSTVEELKAKIEELASKLGNTNLGTLATEVNEASRKTAAMQESHAELLDAMERIKDAMANHTIERVSLKSTMDSLADMAKDISGQGQLMTTYMDKVYKHIQEQSGLKKIIEDVHHIREKLDIMDGEGVEEEGAYEDEGFEAYDAEPASAEHDTEPAIPQAAGSASEAHESEEEEAHVAAPPAEHGTGPAISQAAGGKVKTPGKKAHNTGKQQKPGKTKAIERQDGLNPLAYSQHTKDMGKQRVASISEKRGLPPAALPNQAGAARASSKSPPRHMDPWRSEFPHSEHSEFNLSPSGRASSPSAPGSP